MPCHLVTRADSAREALARHVYRAVLLDLELEDGPAWPVLDTARSLDEGPPIIVLTGQGNEALASEAIHRGAADYWSKTAIGDRLSEIVATASTRADRQREQRDRAQREIRRRLHQQEAVAEFGRAALQGGLEESLWELAAERASAALQADVGRVLELALPDLTLRAAYGCSEQRPGFSLGWYTLQQGRSVLVEDFLTETRFGTPPTVEADGLRSGLSTIIYRNGEPCGVLEVASREARQFDAVDERVLESLAHIFGQELGRRRAEQALAQSKRRMDLLIEQSPLGIIESTVDGRISKWNPAAERIFGYPFQEAFGRSWRDFIPEPERSRWPSLPLGRNFARNLTADGRVIWCEWFTHELLDSEGKGIGWVLMCRDVTGERLAEENRQAVERELARSEAQFRSIFEGIHDGYVRGQLDGRLSMANPAAATLLGFKSPAELLQHEPADLIPPAELPRLKDSLRSAPDGTVVRTAVRLADGSLRTFEGSLRLLCEDGAPTGWETVFRDVTVRERSEEERRARQAAEEANRLKSEFLAHMSHEIRTPLNAILGMAHLLRGTEMSVRQRDLLDTIHLSSQTLLAILNDILDFSKIEAGRLELEEIEYTLADVLRAQLALVARTAEEKGLKLTLRVDAGTPAQLRGDPVRLGQVLANLLSNAVKFTAAGEVELSVTPHAGDLVTFAVRDTGIGLTAEQISGLFEAFSQADRTITRKYGGTGLGLAISARLVERMGGTLRVDSHPGAGSRFEFTVRAEAGQEPGPADGAPTGTALPASARILVVEDNPINQRIARELLEAVGMVVDVAGNGREAVDRLVGGPEPCPYGLVLMDLQMPVLDGYAAARELRAEPRLRDLPIVALTANALRGERERCQEAGMNAYLPKPVDPQLLYATLRRWLPVAAARPEESEELPSVPGLDTANGLLRVAGNAELYRSLLTDFKAEQARYSRELAESLAGGDMARATRLAHTLKGLAGNLGAVDIQHAAAQLENALRESRAWEELLAVLQASLRALGDRLPAAPAPATVEQSPVGRETLSRLQALLERGDTAALELLDGAPPAVRERLREFDFEGALQALLSEPAEAGR